MGWHLASHKRVIPLVEEVSGTLRRPGHPKVAPHVQKSSLEVGVGNVSWESGKIVKQLPQISICGKKRKKFGVDWRLGPSPPPQSIGVFNIVVCAAASRLSSSESTISRNGCLQPIVGRTTHQTDQPDVFICPPNHVLCTPVSSL